eukprot:PITA_11151
MEVVLQDNGLKEFIDQEIPKPETSDAQNLAEWKKCAAKARRIILEGVRYHIVSSLHVKETPHDMWKALMDLYHNNIDQRKLALKKKLQKIKMEKGKTISKYLTKFTQCHDELQSVRIMVVEEIMEEITKITRDGSSLKIDHEENCALAIKENKGKGKYSHSKLDSYHGGKKKDMTKVKCFHCHELGHFYTNCPLKKSKKKSSGGAVDEALASQLELEFSLIACMVSSMMGSVWYLDSGASFHMTGEKELFSDLEEKYLHIHIEMGDDKKYSATGLGTITFQRELVDPLTLKNVMYVPRLKNNLVTISMLEDRGYDVIFSKGKVFLRHIATGQVKKIGIQVKNLYKLEVEECASLSEKVERVQSRDVGELWHRRLGHLHNGAFKILQ